MKLSHNYKIITIRRRGKYIVSSTYPLKYKMCKKLLLILILFSRWVIWLKDIQNVEFHEIQISPHYSKIHSLHVNLQWAIYGGVFKNRAISIEIKIMNLLFYTTKQKTHSLTYCEYQFNIRKQIISVSNNSHFCNYES